MLIRLSLKTLILLISIILVACSSNKIVKTYPGNVLPESAIAILTAPENITLLSVNGVEVQQYLLSNLEVNYGLKEGDNLVVFKYDSIWGKAKKDKETGSRVDVVESESLEVLIPAKSGAKYNFSFLTAENVREAKELAATFSAQIVDEQNNLITESVALNTHQAAKEKALKEEQALLSEKQMQEAGSMVATDLSVIERLKSIWPSASAEEKKAFLVWVFQE